MHTELTMMALYSQVIKVPRSTRTVWVDAISSSVYSRMSFQSNRNLANPEAEIIDEQNNQY